MAKRSDARSFSPARARLPTDPEIAEIASGDIEDVDSDALERALSDAAVPAGAAASSPVAELPPTRILAPDPQRAVPTAIYRSLEETPAVTTAPMPVPEGETEEEDSTTAPLKPAPPVSERPPPPVLEPAYLFIERGPNAGNAVPIPEGELVIGRSSSCGLTLAHSSVSRRHAIVTRRMERFSVRDAGSHNGTLVNGRRIEGETTLRGGDEISLGKAVLVLRHGSSEVVSQTSTSTATFGERPMLKLAVFALAVLLGIATVFAVATLFGPAPQPVTPVAEEPAADVRQPRPDRPPALERRDQDEPAQDAPVAPPVRPAAADGDIDLAAGGEVSAASVFAEARARGESPPSEIEVPKRFVERHEPDPPAPPPRRLPKVARPETGRSAEALAAYEAGDLDKAIAAAKAAGNAALASRIATFKKELATARADLSFKDGAGAVRHFTAALAIDEELSNGWSRLGGEIRVQLSRLFQMAGQQAMDQGDNAKAMGLFERALGYDPANDKCKELVRKLKSGSKAPQPAPTASPAPAPAAAAPAPAAKDPRSAAENAFGD